MKDYEARVQYQAFRFEVGLRVVFTFMGNAVVGVIRERYFDHNGENHYKISVGPGLTRTVMERNIKDTGRDPRSLAPGPNHGEILPPPPPGEMHMRSQDVPGTELRWWA